MESRDRSLSTRWARDRIASSPGHRLLCRLNTILIALLMVAQPLSEVLDGNLSKAELQQHIVVKDGQKVVPYTVILHGTPEVRKDVTVEDIWTLEKKITLVLGWDFH